MPYSGGVRTNREPSKLNSMNYFLLLFTRANVKHYVAFQKPDVNLSTSKGSTYNFIPQMQTPSVSNLVFCVDPMAISVPCG